MALVVLFQYFEQILWPRGNTVWPILSFQGSYICLFKDLIQIFTQPHIFLGIQTFIKKLSLGQYGLTHIVLSTTLYKFPSKLVLKCLLKNRIWDVTVWPIFSFKGSYSCTNFHQKLYIFLFKKIVSGTLWFNPYCLFKDLI